ncbi:MAG: DUF3365 domain-containing protein [Magnetococcales bacterium]|nr:DUF3365 domain-containing protein [Magnetococcales bacterium]
MKLQTRLFLTIGLVLTLAFVGLEALTYQRAKEESVREVKNLAEQLHSVLMATRRVYHHQFLDSGIPLTPKNLGFLPAHALSRISNDFSNWSETGLSFKNVSDRPRNSKNLADKVEMEAIRFFQENRQEQIRFVTFKTDGGEPFFHYSRPIWVEEYCMKCHGKRADAPPTIRDTYSASYDYKLGELRGIMSFKIPATDINQRIIGNFLEDTVIHLASFLLIFFLLGLMVRRFVSTPLIKLKEGMVAIAAGKFDQKLEGLKGDFAQIGRVFNTMGTDIVRQQNALKESEERFKAILDYAPVMIDAFDDQGRCLLWNRECERVFGWSREEINRTDDPLRLIYPDPAVRDEVLRWIKRHDGIFREYQSFTKSGDARIQLWANFRLPNGDHFSLGHDVTERKLAKQELIQAKESAELANRAKSEFLAIMSHEIRTPLNAILGMAEVIQETSLTSRQRGFIEIMGRAGNNLLTLIEDILDLSHIESGYLTLEKKTINLEKLTHEAIEIHGQKADQKGVVIRCHIEAGTPGFFVGDPKRIRQVLLNLLGNGIKFTDQGRVELQVSCPDRHTLVFSISDTGIGIPLEKQSLVFEPFSQADSSSTRRHGGVGLGLSLCRRLMDSMDGKIWLESAPGEGSTFHFSIPLPDTPWREEELGVQAHRPAGNKGGGTDEKRLENRSILLVEDDGDNAMLIKVFLKKSNHRVDWVEDGLQAVENIGSGKRYDLVLMDIQMPVMDGLKATRQIRAWEKEQGLAPTPILALTAHAMMGDKEKSLAAGCNDHITKPITKIKLLALITRYCKPESTS